jgi:mannose-6-phosphate isomerase-like protein (cupin superfamily)
MRRPEQAQALDRLVDRARGQLRAWTDAAYDDPAVAMVELFGYVGDLLSHYAEVIAEEGYLGTTGTAHVPAVKGRFATMALPVAPTTVAPDGSDVHVLLELAGGGMAHFELAPGRTSRAVRHRTVEEIWYVVAGRGEMWRRQDAIEEVVVLEPGVCLTIPLGTEFQFRSLREEPLAAIGVTMPPWPGNGEAELVEGYAEWKTE